MKRYNLIGKRFGRLVVIEQDNERTNKHDTYWLCKCDCGNEKSVTNGHLTSRSVQSCGCLRKERAIAQIKQAAKDNIKHGEAGTSLYSVWHKMLDRCKNKNNSSYKWYGEKGVRVCDEWQDYKQFAKWAYENGYHVQDDVSRAEKLSIDRIDSNGDYCPENCRWIPFSENAKRACEVRYKNVESTDRSRRTTNVV